MRYALILADDGRILSATFAKYAVSGGYVLVDELPEGNVADYRYVDGEYIYDPLPKEPKQEPTPSLEDRVGNLEIDSADMKEALDMILLGVTE